MTKSMKTCVVGYFFSPEAILEAAKKTRDRKFEKFDTFLPFPVHGMDQAMGLKRSPLPYVAFAAAMAGMSGGFLLQTWTHSFSWRVNIAGKPMFSWPAYIPVTFETAILITGLVTTAFMFVALLGLPNFNKKIFHPDLTSHRFALAIEVEGEQQVEAVKQFMKEIQAQEIEAVEASL
ncbi:MAG: DUF3341 domain-containing protein [Bradymonadales bacterium]|nr:MAG: DUF3341 domain-containing protein [Bradymonadales bacterium]